MSVCVLCEQIDPCSRYSYCQMLKCNNVNQRNWHTMTNGTAFYPCNWGLEPNELAVSCFTVNMSMTTPVTVCYHAVPFDTPHARSCLKFWAQEREQRISIVHATSTAKKSL